MGMWLKYWIDQPTFDLPNDRDCQMLTQDNSVQFLKPFLALDVWIRYTWQLNVAGKDY